MANPTAYIATLSFPASMAFGFVQSPLSGPPLTKAFATFITIQIVLIGLVHCRRRANMFFPETSSAWVSRTLIRVSRV